MKISNKGWVIITTVLLVSLVFMYYFLVFVKDKEREIINDNFRVLTQMSRNFHQVIEGNKRIFETRLKNSFTKGMTDNNLTYSDINVGFGINGILLYTSVNSEKGIDDTKDLINKYAHFGNEQLQLIYIEKINKSDEIIRLIKEDSIKIKYDRLLESKKKNISNIPIIVFSFINYNKLFKSDLIERKDVFDFILISQIDGSNQNVLYSNRPGGSILSFGDSLGLLKNKEVFKVDLGASKYLTFNTRIEVSGNEEVILSGFVDDEKMNNSKRQVSVQFLTIAVIGVILLLIGLPLIKLRVMSTFERLYIRDILFSGISVLFAGSLLVLISIFLIDHLINEKKAQDKNLELLYNKITTQLYKELDNASKNLDLFDSLSLARIPDIHLVKGNNNLFKYAWKIPKEVSKDSPFSYFNAVFKADRTGTPYLVFSSEVNPVTVPNLKHRNYVSGPFTDSGFRYKDDYYLESIRSVTDGNYEIGFGREVSESSMIATSFSSATLMEPIVEPGYGYCVFDNTGRTIFHSDISRNLNENFIDEADFNIHRIEGSKSGINLITEYHGKYHFVFVKSIPEIEGLFLATFISSDYVNSPKSIILSTTFVFQFLFFMILLVVYYLLYFFNHKGSMLKLQVFSFNWLRPQLEDVNVVKPIYLNLILINLSVIILNLTLWLFVHQPVILFLDLIINTTTTIIIHYVLLVPNAPFHKRIFFRNSSFIKARYLLMILGSIYAFFILVKVMILGQSYELIDLGLYLIYFGVAVLFLVYKRTKKNKHIKNSYNVYISYLFSFIVLISVVPTLIFYSISNQIEAEILFAANKTNLEAQNNGWANQKLKQYRNLNSNLIGDYTVYEAKRFVEEMASTGFHELVIPKKIQYSGVNSVSDSLFKELYSTIRVEFNDYGFNTSAYLKESNSSNKKNTITNSIGISLLRGRIFYENYNWVYYIILCGIFLFGIFLIIRYSIFKIYGFRYKSYAKNLVPINNLDSIGQFLIDKLKKSPLDESSFNNIFLNGVNASHLFVIRNKLRDDFNQSFINIDFLDIKNKIEGVGLASGDDNKNEDGKNEIDYYSISFWNKIAIAPENAIKGLVSCLKDPCEDRNIDIIYVYIEHFELGFNDYEFNKIKLDLLSCLTDNPHIRVIISSEISPSKIFNFYEVSMQSVEEVMRLKKEAKVEKQEVLFRYRTDYKRWLHLLGGFYRLTIPFEYEGNKHLENIDNIYEHELNNGKYLIKLKEVLEKDKRRRNPNIPDDQIILLIQEIVYPYYFSIWNSLSKEERYTVYDIAKDKFVNTNNVDGIIDLLHKGILVYDSSLRLMNESFANFVLSNVDSDEALARELEKREGGTWSTTSSVLIILIFSLVVFIGFGEVSFLSDINALISSMAAIFAILPRIGGLLKPSS
ncbi:hypothetical protein [Marinigracilibium pacificum]|uniref:Cache domain-containing protein n=1 Tax=Marinigracilibium pacificum TaxID=2729599 RepID=A0A848IZI6_9BACT|nr:hypothetical protein [Marinigracilibium pacificum]NMM49953.1 hypothetical protein [Marinigracilibium pacificum]